ncbi:MAG: hypothetical protein JWO94_3183 [Verrucomicrobiaceae bacterium]|nr:hypothetical protein [Verrucomicrobiaceae bacterium]
MSAPRQILAFLIPLFAAAAVHAATTVVVRPDSSGTANGDTFVTTGPSNNLTGNNYGGAGAISVSAAGLPAGEERSVIRFDVSTVKSSFDSTYGVGNWTLTGVQLELTATAPNNGVFNTSAAGSILVQWVPNDGWVEGGGTPASPSTVAGTLNWNGIAALATGAESEGTFSFLGGTTGTGDYALSASAGLLGDFMSGSQASFILSAADSTVSGVFNTRTFPTTGSRPALIVTAVQTVPEPARAGLMLAGTAGLRLRRRRSI